MNFFKRRRHSHECEELIAERKEQKKRSLHADEDYYRAMRRLALEAHDAPGVGFYNQKLRDLEMLKYELDVLTNDGRET